MVTLGLTNTSSSTCDLRGYPGVSFVGDDDGTQIGAPARRDKQFAPVVRVSPGETADVMIRISQAGNYDSSVCDPTSVDGFRVYPPNNTAALFIRYTAATGCRSSGVTLLTTGPVTK